MTWLLITLLVAIIVLSMVSAIFTPFLVGRERQPMSLGVAIASIVYAIATVLALAWAIVVITGRS